MRHGDATEKPMKILPIGGRVKAASIGLDRFFAGQNGVELDRAITKLRRQPCEHLRRAFFPRTGNELRHMTSGIGLYRPVLKTDQGMPGNFLPFSVDAALERTNLSIRSISFEEGVAISEAWNTYSNGMARDIRAAFLPFDLGATYELLQQFETRRAEHGRPDKGHRPFMFIRPALPERPIVFGKDIVARVEHEVLRLLERATARAYSLEVLQTGTTRPGNLLYVQPDVYVLADGTVTVEKINCPDVVFFLAGVEAESSSALPHVQMIVRQLGAKVVDTIIEKMGTKITIVTRDAVITQLEDVLEIREIDFLREALTCAGAIVNVIPASAVDSVETGSRLLLLNLNYGAAETTTLLRRHAAEEVECFPNPYFQMACDEVTGLQELVLTTGDKHRELFLERASSQPGTDVGIVEALRLMDKGLRQGGITGDILHVVLETETVPVLRNALHSWRQLATRAKRPANEHGVIRIRSIPARPENLILTSSTGPRLHAFRFMCIT